MESHSGSYLPGRLGKYEKAEKVRELKDGRYPIAIWLTHSKKANYIFTGFSAYDCSGNVGVGHTNSCHESLLFSLTGRKKIIFVESLDIFQFHL